MTLHRNIELADGTCGADGVTVSLHAPLPDSLEVGAGQYLVVSGDCACPGETVRNVDVLFDGWPLRAELSPAAGGISFWQAVLVEPDAAGRTVAVDIVVQLDSGRWISRPAGLVECRAVAWEPVVVPEALHGPGMAAVCMATYNPDPAAFNRQIDSIRAQSYGRWICIVNDDGSSPDAWRAMQESCAGDPRFVLCRNPENLGFYGNFEQALKRVPESADYVAFSDQDDFWYPDKLSRLVDTLESESALLAYSDMRIVDAQGAELAPTYWVNRRNEYRDLPVVLVANTVTGAASLFRREILEDLVPFPPRVGDAFHDHWLACTALSTGSLAYVDEPLYDYYQYGSSVIGHCDFTRFSMLQRVASLLRLCFRLCVPRIAAPLLRRKYASALAIYRGECRRLRLVEGTIRQRCRLGAARRRQLHTFGGGAGSFLKLLVLHAKVLARGQTTDDAELRLAMGELARMVEKWRGGRE